MANPEKESEGTMWCVWWSYQVIQGITFTPFNTLNDVNILKILLLNYMLYMFNTHTRFHVNQILFDIQLINSCFMHNL